MTNCVPGDIARVVGFSAPVSDANDRLVRVVSPTIVNRLPGWTLEEPLCLTISDVCRTANGAVFVPGDRAQITEIADKHLRPIRHPGDDAVDEMLRPLPTQFDETLRPKRQIENA